MRVATTKRKHTVWIKQSKEEEETYQGGQTTCHLAPPHLALVPLFSLFVTLHIHPMVRVLSMPGGWDVSRGSVTHLGVCLFVPGPWSVFQRREEWEV